jgi:hypothetical protein
LYLFQQAIALGATPLVLFSLLPLHRGSLTQLARTPLETNCGRYVHERLERGGAVAYDGRVCFE